jgi:hypothetical protein
MSGLATNSIPKGSFTSEYLVFTTPQGTETQGNPTTLLKVDSCQLSQSSRFRLRWKGVVSECSKRIELLSVDFHTHIEEETVVLNNASKVFVLLLSPD